jgi:hypothetical protein
LFLFPFNSAPLGTSASWRKADLVRAIAAGSF